MNAPMDATERRVYEYLLHCGFSGVVYEPDGNVPPDFSVEGRIAIEARRLNQHEDAGGVVRGLEETAIPFGQTVRQVLKTFGPPRDGASWFVGYSFQRPVPDRRVTMRLLRSALEQFAEHPQSTPQHSVELTHNFTLDFRPASKPHAQMFVLGGSGDHDSGGFVVSELMRNLSICVAGKSRRIAKCRSRYPEWWLVLVDHIAYGSLESEDVELLRGERTAWLGEIWQRIVLVSPLDPKRSIEL
jgi:hypothetical protein